MGVKKIEATYLQDVSFVFVESLLAIIATVYYATRFKLGFWYAHLL